MSLFPNDGYEIERVKHNTYESTLVFNKFAFFHDYVKSLFEIEFIFSIR